MQTLSWSVLHFYSQSPPQSRLAIPESLPHGTYWRDERSKVIVSHLESDKSQRGLAKLTPSKIWPIQSINKALVKQLLNKCIWHSRSIEAYSTSRGFKWTDKALISIDASWLYKRMQLQKDRYWESVTEKYQYYQMIPVEIFKKWMSVHIHVQVCHVYMYKYKRLSR